MCITFANPSEPCCEAVSRCRGCPEFDWSEFTWLYEHDAWTAPNGFEWLAWSTKLTAIIGSECLWGANTNDFVPTFPVFSIYGPFDGVTLWRDRAFFDADRQWWRLRYSIANILPVDYGYGPYEIESFRCTGTMILTRSQTRLEELESQGNYEGLISLYPETVRLTRVAGQCPVLPI